MSKAVVVVDKVKKAQVHAVLCHDRMDRNGEAWLVAVALTKHALAAKLRAQLVDEARDELRDAALKASAIVVDEDVEAYQRALQEIRALPRSMYALVSYMNERDCDFISVYETADL